MVDVSNVLESFQQAGHGRRQVRAFLIYQVANFLVFLDEKVVKQHPIDLTQRIGICGKKKNGVFVISLTGIINSLFTWNFRWNWSKVEQLSQERLQKESKKVKS
jgi:hypothetical protein